MGKQEQYLMFEVMRMFAKNQKIMTDQFIEKNMVKIGHFMFTINF